MHKAQISKLHRDPRQSCTTVKVGFIAKSGQNSQSDKHYENGGKLRNYLYWAPVSIGRESGAQIVSGVSGTLAPR